MGFVKERTRYNADKKKMISARVSNDVMEALNSAEGDVDALGYGFSITQIIEEAFNDTLKELKKITGIDYYKLIKWKRKIIKAEKCLPATQALIQINIDDEIERFKDYFNATRGLNGVLDFDELLQRHEDSIVDNWNECIKEQSAQVEKNTLNIFYSEPSIGEFASEPVQNVSGHTVQTLSRLLRKSTDEVIDTLNNAGVTGKNADSRISTDDRQKLISSLSRSPGDGVSVKLK